MKLKNYSNYLKWDYQSRNDSKNAKLIMKEGNEGYGILIQLIEFMYENDGIIEDDLDFIAFQVHTIDIEKLKRILNNYDIFIKENNYYTNNRCNEALEERKKQSTKNKENGKKGGRPKKIELSEIDGKEFFNE